MTESFRRQRDKSNSNQIYHEHTVIAPINKISFRRSSHICVSGGFRCDLAPPPTPPPIISHHITLHWRWHPSLQCIPVRPGGDESILRQNDSTGFLFCARCIPTLQPTDWLTALWLRPSLSQLLLSSPLSLSPRACDLMWMDADAGRAFRHAAFTHQTVILSSGGGGGRRDGRWGRWGSVQRSLERVLMMGRL